MDNLVNPGLTFEVLKDRAKDFIGGKISKDELSEWGKTINIRMSISFREKKEILNRIIAKYAYEDTSMDRVFKMYIDIFFYLYLAYLGLDELDINEVNEYNYDLMEPLYGPWIEGCAKRDIENTKAMLSCALNLYHIIDFNNTLDSLDYDKIKESKEANEEIISYLQNNKDVLEKLNNISILNDPQIAEIRSMLQK